MILNEDFYEDDIISKIYSIKYKVNDSGPLLEKELNRRKQPNFSSQRDFENFLSKHQTYDVICFDSSHNQICRYNNLSEDDLVTTFSYSIKESIVNNYNAVGSVSEIFIDDIETVEQQSIHNSNNFSELKQFISENVKSMNELKPKYFENKFLIYHNDIYDEYFSKYDVNEGVVKTFNY